MWYGDVPIPVWIRPLLAYCSASAATSMSFWTARVNAQIVGLLTAFAISTTELKSPGLIICPARSKPEVGLKELREDFVTNTGKRLAEKAAKCGTSIVLEPLQRKETPFLRQVSDAAKMAQEIGDGCTVLADFWHMTWEEPNDRAAILSAGPLLAHVHIASRKNRKTPGSDGAADDYRLGFRALKEIGYNGAVSLEAGWVPKGMDAKGKPILPDLPERHLILTKMCDFLRAQWAQV